MLGDIKISRVQLSVIGILFALIVFFVMPFSAEKNDNLSLNSDNQYLRNKPSLAKERDPSTSEGIKYGQFQQLMTSTHKTVESTIAVFQSSNASALEATSNNSLSLLDDESLLNISDILENSLVPAFSRNSTALDNHFEQKAAIDVFVSRLPEGLSDLDFQQINSLLRDYLPYDLADTLVQEVEQSYRLNEREQAYLSSALANTKSAETMAEQIVIAMHLAKLKGEEVQQEPEIDLEPSEAFLNWQKTEEKFKQIQSISTDPNQDIHEVIKDEYGSEVADDYVELANAETQWVEKYSAFLVEKNIISESGLSEQDKAEQIEDLIHQHYQENEWAAARAYDEMMLSRH